MPDIAPDKSHVAHDARHDLDGGNRQRRAEKKRSHEAVFRLGKERLRQQIAEQDAAGEGQRNSGH